MHDTTQYTARQRVMTVGPNRDRAVRGPATANLEEAKLHRAKMLVPRMRMALLCRADLSEAGIVRPVFRGADLRGAKLDGARVTNAVLENALYDEDAAEVLTTTRDPDEMMADDGYRLMTFPAS